MITLGISLDIDDSDLHLTPVVRSSSSTHVEPSPYTPNPVTIIPGPASIVQLLVRTVFEPLPSTLNPARIIPSPAVVEDVGEDDDFKSPAWVSATNYVNAFCGHVMDVLGDRQLSGKRKNLNKLLQEESCAAMILANVFVFTPKPSQHYLNITMRNVVEVFRKDVVLGSGSG
ncbi:serine carboxypeptidase S28 family protein [Tanacetum coccineum]|uniref:Serine carboxypeptidase S28 family protein n=1 Tax=Tanacetum coccineum TaxID=301880 RepID=A0ABQ5ENJ8_9ASTR